MVEGTPDHLVPHTDLLRLAASMFAASGVEAAPAHLWASALVWANLRGVDSHGVMRIPRYLELIAKGAIKPRPDIQVSRKAGAIAVLECDRAPGPIGMMRAMEQALELAGQVHLGWCAARNLTHSAAVGYYALQAAERGMIGIAMSASGPLMAYHGSRKAGLSTNPLAIAIPTARRRPFLLDMSTANVALGKVLDARDRGITVPAGWGLDANGRDTTDPRQIATLLPFSGAKGSGLSFMIECLCSLLVANPRIAPALLGAGVDDPSMNGVAVAINIAAFGDAEQFRREADLLGDAIAALPPIEEGTRVLLPGERGDRVMSERERRGIPVPEGTWTRIVSAAERLGIEVPA